MLMPVAVLPALVVALIAGADPAAAAPAFEVSESYEASAELVPGRYACVSGLDFSTQTWTFDLAADGRYTIQGIEGEGELELAPDGSLALLSGPFAPDETAGTSAMNTTRVSDGVPVIIIRYDFGAEVTDDYCARFS